MSLDVYLVANKPLKKSGTGVFVRQEGKTVELTSSEVKERWPDSEVGDTDYETNYVYSDNITHNLGEMADKAGIYYALWRPDEKGWTQAKDIVPILIEGLTKLRARPDYFRTFDSPNGWGSYKNFVPFVEKYLDACRKYPDAKIEVSR